jgi:hypothetical protein
MLRPKVDANNYEAGYPLKLKNGKTYEVYEASNGTHKWKLIRREYNLKKLDEKPDADANSVPEGFRAKRRGGYYIALTSSDGRTKKWYKVSNMKTKPKPKPKPKSKSRTSRITKNDKKEVLKMLKDDIKASKKKTRRNTSKTKVKITTKRRRGSSKDKVKTVVKERVKKNGDIVKTTRTTRIIKKSRA